MTSATCLQIQPCQFIAPSSYTPHVRFKLAHLMPSSIGCSCNVCYVLTLVVHQASAFDIRFRKRSGIVDTRVSGSRYM